MSDSIISLCTPDRLVRSNYYSSTYRANFSLGDVIRDWDITHISLPFEYENEQQLITRFGVTPAQLNECYKAMGKCIKNDRAIVTFLNELKNPNISAAVVKYNYAVAHRKQSGGSDVYFITEPMQSFSSSQYLFSNSITLSSLLSFGARITQTLKLLDEVGVRLGAVDLDCIYLTTDGEKQMVKVGSFLYASKDSDTQRIPMPATLPLNAHESVRNGEKPTLYTDTYSVCALIWTIASGTHYTELADLSVTPEYAPAEMVELLRLGVDPDRSDIKSVNKGFHDLLRKIKKGELADYVIQMKEPSYAEKEILPWSAPTSQRNNYHKQESLSVDDPDAESADSLPPSAAEAVEIPTMPDSELTSHAAAEAANSQGESNTSPAENASDIEDIPVVAIQDEILIVVDEHPSSEADSTREEPAAQKKQKKKLIPFKRRIMSVAHDTADPGTDNPGVKIDYPAASDVEDGANSREDVKLSASKTAEVQMKSWTHSFSSSAEKLQNMMQKIMAASKPQKTSETEEKTEFGSNPATANEAQAEITAPNIIPIEKGKAIKILSNASQNAKKKKYGNGKKTMSRIAIALFIFGIGYVALNVNPAPAVPDSDITVAVVEDVDKGLDAANIATKSAK